MSKSANELLEHILKEANYLVEKSQTLSEEKFMYDETVQRAFERIEIIGEATKNLPKDFRENHKQIDWSSIAKMRDKLIHHYFGTDYAIVWDVVNNEIPKLRKQIMELKKHE